MMKAYTRGQGKTKDERGEPCLHKASTLAMCMARHTLHTSANFATNAHLTAVKEWVGVGGVCRPSLGGGGGGR